MYITAQHVRSPQRIEGINSFFYLHGAYVWTGEPPAGIPDENPGELMWQGLAVPQGGNRIRSYLDIVAPDETPWTEIRQRFVMFVSGHQLQAMPWSGVSGRCLFRANMDQALAQQWHREIADLYRAAQSARIGGSPLSASIF